MQKSPPSILSYNSLLDEHLAEYYSSPQRKRHLRRMGLITRDGRLVDERTFQRRATQREYRRRYKDDVATNTAVAVSEKQSQQKAELKKKLEALAKYETVQRIKRERLHPPGIQTYNPERALKQSLSGLGKATLANKTAPTLNSLSDTCLSGAIEKHKERVSFTPDELGELKHLVKTIAGPRVAAATIVQAKAGYCPLSTTKPRASKKEPGHRRPSTAPTKPSQPKTAGKATERLVQEKESVTMTLGYLGTTKAFKNKKPLTDVEVWQQAQGFTPVRVFKDLIRPGETFSFQSIRQPGMPFALVIYTGGMIDCRVSVCCEYRHHARTRLGGRSAHFKVSSIKGGSPCHLCQKAKEERKSRKKAQQEAQSTTLQSTQLESLLTQSGEEDEREGEVSRSPSPSHYSSSFSSESSQDSGDEGGGRRGSVDSPYSLSESKHSAVLGDVDESLNNGVDTSIDPVLYAEETNSAKQDGGQDATTAEARPELVTRGGVRIVYQLGPVPTSEHGTQTDEQVPVNEPECGTTVKAPETRIQTEEQTTANIPEHGQNDRQGTPPEMETQTDEQTTPETRTETGDHTTAETPELGTQTDEQPLENAAALTYEECSHPSHPSQPSTITDTSNNIESNKANEGIESDNPEPTKEALQTPQESLSSSEDNEPKDEDDGELTPVARNTTLTDVSERTSISSSSSVSPVGGSQTELADFT